MTTTIKCKQVALISSISKHDRHWYDKCDLFFALHAHRAGWHAFNSHSRMQVAVCGNRCLYIRKTHTPPTKKRYVCTQPRYIRFRMRT